MLNKKDFAFALKYISYMKVMIMIKYMKFYQQYKMKKLKINNILIEK